MCNMSVIEYTKSTTDQILSLGRCTVMQQKSVCIQLKTCSVNSMFMKGARYYKKSVLL